VENGITARRTVLAMALGLAPGLALQTPLAAAQSVEEITVRGHSIEDTVPQDLRNYGSRLEIITAEQLERQSFTDVSQALQMLVPGLHIAPKNGPFDYFDASLQGSRAQEILWLIDGVRITNRLYNGTSPLDTIPSHMIERIEVLKGGQGIFYGTQAVSGVINIVTKSFTRSSDSAVGVGAHSNGGGNINGYHRSSVGDHQFVAYASRDQARGYQPFSDADAQPSATQRRRGYEVNVLGLKYGWAINQDTRLSLQYQHGESELDFSRPFRNAETVNDRIEDIVTAKVDLNVGDNVSLYVKGYFHSWDTRYTRVHNELDDSGQMTGGLQVLNDGSYWGYDDYGLTAVAKFNDGNGLEYIAGLDHQSFSGEDDVWRIADQREKVNAAFLQLRTTEQLLENTSIAVGVRSNRPSNVQNSTVWNLSARHQLSDALYLTTNLGTSFRLPDAEQLFLNELYDADNNGIPDDGWFAVGNPDLKPEKSRNINVGIGGVFGDLQYELISFNRKITDYIDSYVPIVISGVTGESFVNSDDTVRVRGAELIAAMLLSEDWHGNVSFTHTRARLNNAGGQLTSIPDREAKLSLNYEPSGAAWGMTLAANYVGDINERQASTAGNYTAMDISGFYHFGAGDKHRLTLKLENITDEQYVTRVDRATRDTGGTYLYGNLGMHRTAHVGYTYQF